MLVYGLNINCHEKLCMNMNNNNDDDYQYVLFYFLSLTTDFNLIANN